MFQSRLHYRVFINYQILSPSEGQTLKASHLISAMRYSRYFMLQHEILSLNIEVMAQRDNPPTDPYNIFNYFHCSNMVSPTMPDGSSTVKSIRSSKKSLKKTRSLLLFRAYPFYLKPIKLLNYQQSCDVSNQLVIHLFNQTSEVMSQMILGNYRKASLQSGQN